MTKSNPFAVSDGIHDLEQQAMAFAGQTVQLSSDDTAELYQSLHELRIKARCLETELSRETWNRNAFEEQSARLRAVLEDPSSNVINVPDWAARKAGMKPAGTGGAA
ncbi:MAG: hypothetical protein AAF141_02830 [Pseudomonadota bacterium]